MRKRQALTVETSRPKPLSTLIAGPKAKLEQDKYQFTDPGDSITGDLGTTSLEASAIEIDPLAPPATDDVGTGQTIYQRLTLTAGEYCPVFPPAFYRRVWFDGLEALEGTHFTKLGNGCILPKVALPSGTVVTAYYVKT